MFVVISVTQPGLNGMEQQISLDGNDEKETVELVTLSSEQLTHGIGAGNALPFPDIESALAYARGNLSKDERDCSWIRSGDTVQPLADEPFSSPEPTSTDRSPDASGNASAEADRDGEVFRPGT
jgi:hypothetical protein